MFTSLISLLLVLRGNMVYLGFKLCPPPPYYFCWATYNVYMLAYIN